MQSFPAEVLYEVRYSVPKGVSTMTFEQNILDQIDALHERGRDFVERGQKLRVAVEYAFDVCTFDEQWER